MSPLNDNLKISVIIPTYNRVDTIINCLNSILNQSYKVNEIIIVDDCSTDNTIKVLKQVNNASLKIIQNPTNLGAQKSRNIGIESAANDWIAFLDADDTWLPEKIEKQIQLIEKYYNHYPWIAIQSNCLRNENNTIKKWGLNTYTDGNFYEEILCKPGPMFQGLLTTKKALEKIGYLDESIISFQEWDTNIMLAKYCKFFWTNDFLFNYNLNNTGSEFRSNKRSIEGRLQILNKNKKEIKHHHNNKFYKLIYIIIKDCFFSGLHDLGEKTLFEYKNNINVIDKLKLWLISIFNISEHKWNLLKYFVSNPWYGLKHMIKSITKDSYSQILCFLHFQIFQNYTF